MYEEGMLLTEDDYDENEDAGDQNWKTRQK